MPAEPNHFIAVVVQEHVRYVMPHFDHGVEKEAVHTQVTRHNLEQAKGLHTQAVQVCHRVCQDSCKIFMNI